MRIIPATQAILINAVRTTLNPELAVPATTKLIIKRLLEIDK